MTILSRATVFLFFSLWSGVTAAEKIDINSAPLEDLVKIVHIGETRAKELISLRPFFSLDDLARIKGIGETKVEDIKNEGLAWIEVRDKGDKASFSDPLIEENPQSIVYPLGVIINEILPSPLGSDETEEWIEIFNQNSFEVDLSNWQISDAIGDVKVFTIPKETKIPAKGFLIFERPSTKIVLNNSDDEVNFLNPDGGLIDKVAYNKAPNGESFVKEGNSWFWSGIITPGAKNIVSSLTQNEIKTRPEQREIKINTISLSGENSFQEETAAIVEKLPQRISFSVLLISFILAAFSSISILFLRVRLQQKKNLLE